MPLPLLPPSSAAKTAEEIASTEPYLSTRPLTTTADVLTHNALAVEMGFELCVMHAPPLALEPNPFLDAPLAPIRILAA